MIDSNRHEGFYALHGPDHVQSYSIIPPNLLHSMYGGGN